MSRFNSEAYDKLFPRTQQKEVVESAVETFKPSEAESEKVEEVVEKTVEKATVKDSLLDETMDAEVKGGGAEVESVEQTD